MGETCRLCDGRGTTPVLNDYEEVIGKKNCGRCYGKGVDPGPPKGDGKRRFFRQPKVKLDEGEQSLEQQGDAWLAKHGFGKHGR